MKEEQIDKSPDDSHMNLFAFRKADGFACESFDTCAHRERIPFHTLRIFLAVNQLIIGNFIAAGEVIVRVNRPNGKRLKQFQKFLQILMSPRAKL